jgi:hypothetical protein
MIFFRCGKFEQANVVRSRIITYYVSNLWGDNGSRRI